jgi:hypothetical protein
MQPTCPISVCAEQAALSPTTSPEHNFPEQLARKTVTTSSCPPPLHLKTPLFPLCRLLSIIHHGLEKLHPSSTLAIGAPVALFRRCRAAENFCRCCERCEGWCAQAEQGRDFCPGDSDSWCQDCRLCWTQGAGVWYVNNQHNGECFADRLQSVRIGQERSFWCVFETRRR